MPNEIVGAFIGAFAAVLVLVLQGVAHWWRRPVLHLDFRGGDPAYTTSTVEGPHGQHHIVKNHARYLRLRVTNNGWGVATGCRAYLVKVEKWDDTQIPRATIYCDSLRLNWSAQTETDKAMPLAIPRGINQFVDLLSTRETSTDFRMEMPFGLRRYYALFREHGTFRFTVLVAGDGVTPKTATLLFTWSGVWDQFSARAD
jgi:hypothetical protein